MAYRLSGFPASVEVSCEVALINPSGTGPSSAAKTATPGSAAPAAPSLWGSIAHGAGLSDDPLDVSAWTLDNATEDTLGADSPYTAPRRVISALFFGRKNTAVATLSIGVMYPFVAVFRAGTSNAARIVIRHSASGGEARITTSGFGSVAVGYSGANIGTISGAAIEALGGDWYRMSGVFTPSIADVYLFGVGPNPAGAVEGYVDVYGGELAAPDGPDPDPDPVTAPAAFATEQWRPVNPGTDGETLIVEIDSLPDDGGSALLGIGYRLNGSETTIPFPSIAPGSYQIAVPSETEASIVLRATNAIGSSTSAPQTETPTVGAMPDQGEADGLTFANAIWTGKGALDPGAGQIILLGATTLATSGETYINGVRLFNVDGSQWHVRRWGDLQYVPNGAHDALNADEFTDVSVAWRKTDDESSSTFTLRVYGSQMTGDDLARGETPATSMTLTESVPEGAVLEVAFTAGGSACTPSLGGVAGASCPAGKRDVQYLRAPAGGSAALTFSTTPVAPVHARVVLTPGNAAAIRRMSASRSGTTLSLDWRTMPRSGFPNTAGWQEFGGTPESPEVRDRNSGATGFQISTGFVEWKRVTGPGASFFAHDFRITGANCVVKAKAGFANALIYDGEGYGPIWSGASPNTQGQFIKPLENISSWPDSGDFWCYDTVFDLGMLSTSGNNEAIDGDAYIRNMLIDLHFMNGDWRDTGDAIADMKGRACFHAMTFGQSQRAIRAWHHPTVYGRSRLDGPYSQAVINQSERGGIVALWMVDQPGDLRVRDEDDVAHSLGLSAFGYVADIRQTAVMRSKPAYPPDCDYAATDFEFEQSLDNQVSWSSLTVARVGPNDAWGATRRTIAGVSTSITHVRGRALWGAKVGEWLTVAVTS